MRKYLTILFLFSLLFSLHIKAQHKLISPEYSSSLFTQHALLFFSHNLNVTQTEPGKPFFFLLQPKHPSEIKSGAVKDLPFFCALECRLRAQTGIWIKFRTGNDDSYETMIRYGSH